MTLLVLGGTPRSWTNLKLTSAWAARIKSCEWTEQVLVADLCAATGDHGIQVSIGESNPPSCALVESPWYYPHWLCSHIYPLYQCWNHNQWTLFFTSFIALRSFAVYRMLKFLFILMHPNLGTAIVNQWNLYVCIPHEMVYLQWQMVNKVLD